jgi:spore germination protein GerM
MATADSNGMIAVSAPVTPGSSTPAKDAIEALISEPNSPIPPGTKLLRLRLASKTGIATVDFSSEFVNNFPGGDEAAAQVIDSIRSTLGQFHSIKKVRFFVEGKQLTEYGGAYDMTDPISVTHSKDASDEKDLQHDKRKGASSL